MHGVPRVQLEAIGVNERTAILLGAIAGAIAGSACGYLFLTERGRRLREDLGPELTDLLSELKQAGGTARRAKAAVAEAFPSSPPFGST